MRCPIMRNHLSGNGRANFVAGIVHDIEMDIVRLCSRSATIDRFSFVDVGIPRMGDKADVGDKRAFADFGPVRQSDQIS